MQIKLRKVLGSQKEFKSKENSWPAKFHNPKKALAKMVIVRSPKKPAAKSKLGCEKGPSLRNDFAAPCIPFTKIFAVAKHLLGT